jgi:hypothetical protein
MANQGFVQELNLAEITDGEEIINNLAGGTTANDLRVFRGLSSEKSLLFFDRFKNSSVTQESKKSIELGTNFEFDTVYNYTDDDIVEIQPINLLEDYDFEYVGFDSDQVLTNPLSGYDITFDRGQLYEPGTYQVKFKGGGGTFESAEAEVIVSDGLSGSIGFRGQISSVKITSSGTTQVSGTNVSGFKQGDALFVSRYSTNGGASYTLGDIPGDEVGIPGAGFSVTLTGFPWRVLLVGNYAWDPSDLQTANLKIEISNTSNNLNGIYDVRKINGVNKFVSSNNSNEKAYDINRKIYAQERITTNLELFDVDGDGVLSEFDIRLLEVFFTNSEGYSQAILADFIDDVKDFVQDYIDAGNNPGTGAVRINPASLVAYMEGLNKELLNIDGISEDPDADDIALLRTYISNSDNSDGATAIEPGSLYVARPASTSITESEVNSTGLYHVISTAVRVEQYPNYTFSNNGYIKPFFTIYKNSSGTNSNIFDIFSKFGRKLTCTTNESDWISIPIGSSYTQGTIQYRIADKFTALIGSTTQYYVIVVCSGQGFSIGTTFSSFNLLTVTSIPVIDSNDSGVEYAIFDANGRDQFYLKTQPRSSIENDKKIVLIAESYILTSDESTTYSGVTVPTTTLFPDVIFRRDDSLTIENVANLEPPEIIEENSNEFGREGGFSYNVDGGYSEELDSIGDTVDLTSFLKDQKYRIDRSLYYEKDIAIDGLITALDPDNFNVGDNELSDDISPGIFISDAGSQITNDLRSDFAGKTRSFSSDYNPWETGDGVIETTSYGVNINDLFFSTSISLELRQNNGASPYQADNSKFVGGNGSLSENLAGNFQIVPANPTAFKLKVSINGEEFFILMKKS